MSGASVAPRSRSRKPTCVAAAHSAARTSPAISVTERLRGAALAKPLQISRKRSASPRHTPAMRPLDQQNILITGSTDGLGRALAQRLAAKGAHVLVHGRDPGRVDDAVRDTGA